MKMKKKNEREKKEGNEKEEEATFFAIHKWINERSIVCSHGNHRRMIVAHKGSGVKKSHFENVMLVWCIVILHAQDSDVMLIWCSLSNLLNLACNGNLGVGHIWTCLKYVWISR